MLSPHWFDRASSFGLGTVKQCPAHVPYTLLSYPKPSAFHSHVSTCQPTIGASFQPTALNRPRTLPATFTLSHIQSLSSFLSHAPNRHARNRSARAFPHAAASRRNAVSSFCRARCALCSYLDAGRPRTAKGLFIFFPKPCRVRCARRLPTQARRRTFPPHHVADHIQPHSPAQYGRQCSQPTVRHRAPTPSLLTTLPRQRLSAFRCSAHLNPQALRRPRTQPHRSAHANAPSPARHLPSPAPNHPPVGRALGSASLSPEKACFAHKLFSAGSVL